MVVMILRWLMMVSFIFYNLLIFLGAFLALEESFNSARKLFNLSVEQGHLSLHAKLGQLTTSALDEIERARVAHENRKSDIDGKLEPALYRVKDTENKLNSLIGIRDP